MLEDGIIGVLKDWCAGGLECWSIGVENDCWRIGVLEDLRIGVLED